MAASDHLGIQFHPETFAGYGMGEHRFLTSLTPGGVKARNSEATANDLGQRDAVERLHGQQDTRPLAGDLEHFHPQTTFRWTN